MESIPTDAEDQESRDLGPLDSGVREPLLVGDDPAEPRSYGGRHAEHWVILGVALLSLVGLVLLGMVLEPDPRGFGTHEKLGMRPCMPLELWNVPCPGCGVTTSVTHAVRGDLLGSLRVQPFGIVVVLVVLVLSGWALSIHLRGRDLWDELSEIRWARWMSVLGVLMGAAWIYKTAVVRGWF